MAAPPGDARTPDARWQPCLDAEALDIGPPGNEKGRPRQDAPISSNVQNLDNQQGTPSGPQTASRRTEPVNVWAHGYFTVGTRGKLALTMIVTGCVFCGRAHRHNGRPDFVSGKRTASCGHGRYVVHLGTLEGCEAA